MEGSVLGSVSLARRLYRRLRSTRLHKPRVRQSWIELGSDYGGWPVIPARLGDRPIVYSFGVGDDVSFDLAVIERFSAIVHAFDPTPSSARWVSGQSLPEAFRFHEWGIGGEDGTAFFYPPAQEGHMSFSNAPSDAQRGEPVRAQILTLATIMRRLGHDRIDLLKMDVEGFEYDTLRDIEASDIRPDQLLVEFHHGMYQASDADTLGAVTRLEAMGYDLYFVSDTGREYGFVRR